MTDHETDACLLDSKDRIILDSLEHDGRMTLAQLAAATSLSVSATQSRVQKLEHKGVITGYKAILDHEKSGQPVSAYISLTPLDYAEAPVIPEKLRDVDGIIYGLLISFVTGLVVDKLMYGVNAGKLALIVTEHGDTVAKVIDQCSGRGSTLIDVKGSFQYDEKQLVMCACSNK